MTKPGAERYEPLEDHGAQERSSKQERNPHPWTNEGVLASSSEVPGNRITLLENLPRPTLLPT